MASPHSATTFDVLVVGGGILGVSLAAWLGWLYEGHFALLEKEASLALHTTSRNTGVVHRPFYLDPDRKRVFARSAEVSYHMWKGWALHRRLPWMQLGTLEVATEESEAKALYRYLGWGISNGMDESELEVLDGRDVAKLEPEVRCRAAIHCKTDAGVSYYAFARSLAEDAKRNGVEMLTDARVVKMAEGKEGVKVWLRGSCEPLISRLVINCAGGNSLDLAKGMGLAQQYEDLHFRGEYWQVDSAYGVRVNRNVYSVPRHREFPFLDPHFIVRADGRREVGPNAVLVAGPNTYSGLANTPWELLSKVVERPIGPKLRLMTNPSFISLVSQEWRSSIFKSAMCNRVARFIPSLSPHHLVGRGFAGVRSSVIDSKGFLPEAIEIATERTFHVLNYNSPGATGAPAYAARALALVSTHCPAFNLRRKAVKPLWDYDLVVEAL